MNTEEKFVFDLEGYIVIKGVLSPDEVAELNDLADRKFETYPYGGAEQGREMSLIPWGDPVKKLIDHPRVLPYLVELLGPRLRLDHDYGMFMRPGDRHGGLHGGHGGSHWYRFHNGAMENGLTVVTYFLSDNPAGVGGFACVPGSHKSNFSTAEIPEDVRDFTRDAHYVVQPVAAAGDALIFTEATIHGTFPWCAPHERRALLFKYSPGHSSWALDYYERFDVGSLTERQQSLMAPPSVEKHPDVAT
jgi:hypothetical protein